VPPQKTEAQDQVRPKLEGVISWAPPQENWNPWTACNIDDGPLALVRILPVQLHHYIVFIEFLPTTGEQRQQRALPCSSAVLLIKEMQSIAMA